MPTPSVPFTVRRRDHGVSETKGSLYVDGEDLVIETQTTTLGVWKRDPDVVRLDLTDLERVGHRRTLLGDRLSIRTRPMSLVSEIPGANEGSFEVSIRRRHRDALARVLDRLELWLS